MNRSTSAQCGADNTNVGELMPLALIAMRSINARPRWKSWPSPMSAQPLSGRTLAK
jgi:hypothetical protein